MFNKLFKKKSKAPGPIEKYKEHLNLIFEAEPEYYLNKSTSLRLEGVSSLVYRDLPEKGMITAVTYGLSLAPHPHWKEGRPELMISVKSDDISWGQVAGYLANQLRGDCPFIFGNTINFGGPVSDSSEMDAFLVFAPSVVSEPEMLKVDLGLDYKVHITGLYPIYASEMQLVEEWGLEKFLHHPGFDAFDVNRDRIEE